MPESPLDPLLGWRDLSPFDAAALWAEQAALAGDPSSEPLAATLAAEWACDHAARILWAWGKAHPREARRLSLQMAPSLSWRLGFSAIVAGLCHLASLAADHGALPCDAMAHLHTDEDWDESTLHWVGVDAKSWPHAPLPADLRLPALICFEAIVPCAPYDPSRALGVFPGSIAPGLALLESFVGQSSLLSQGHALKPPEWLWLAGCARDALDAWRLELAAGPARSLAPRPRSL
jgi:hypothetical protein